MLKIEELNLERLTILSDAVVHRQKEVLHHQINIDNYVSAIAEIEANHTENPAMQEFASQLRELLRTSRIEQSKEKLLLHVILKQLSKDE